MVHDAGQLHDGLFQQGGRGLPFGQTGQEDQGISFHAGGQGKSVCMPVMAQGQGRSGNVLSCGGKGRAR